MRKPESHSLPANRLSQRMLAILLSLVLAVSMRPLPSYADEGSATLEGATDAQVAEDAPALEADAAETGDASVDGGQALDTDLLTDQGDPEAQTDPQGQQELCIIGDEGAARYSLQVENSTGFAIEGLEVKASASDDWRALAMGTDWAWAADEAVMLCLPDLRDTVDPALLGQVGNDSAYDLRILAAGESYDLHAVLFDDVESVRFCWDAENGIYFLEMGYPDGRIASTFEAEIAIRDAEAAAESQDTALEPAAEQGEFADEGAPDDAMPAGRGEGADSAEADAQDDVGDGGAAEGASRDDENASDGGDVLLSVQESEELIGIDSSRAGVDYAEGEVLVFLEDGMSVSAVEDMLEQSPASEAQEITEGELVAAELSDGEIVAGDVLDPGVVVQLEPDVSVPQAVAELSEQEGVVSVSPNYLFQAFEDSESGQVDVESGDGALDAQGRIFDSSFHESNAAAEDSIHLPEAWELKRSEHGVAVAVIDTGCDVGHEDLAGNAVATYNAADKSSDVTDNHGHGTHVAGIVAAQAGNGVGVAGASYNADLVVVKVMDDNNSMKSSYVINALDWVIQNKDAYNIRVVNMSLGTLGLSSDKMGDAFCQQIDAAKNAGILVVAAAGNAGDGVTVPNTAYPGDYDACLSVINLGGSDFSSRYSSSNYNMPGTTESTPNATKDISAPGTRICSTYQGGYASLTGTSMASPMVAGVAALCFAADPSLSPDDVIGVLEGTATDLGAEGWDEETGYGRVDAEAALRQVMGLPEPEPEPEPVKVDLPEAKTGLVWNGEEQAGIVADADACIVEGGSATAVGRYTATVSLNEGYVWQDGTTEPKQVEWSITGTISSTSATKVTLSKTSYTYTGKAIKPTVKVSVNGVALESGTDYKIAYSNNVNPGKASVKVTGMGLYSGSVTKTFQIAALPLSKGSMALAYTAAMKTGKAIKPSVTVRYSGKTLVAGTDYTVSYKGNVNAGTATVTVTGKGKYGGTLKRSFTIFNKFSGWKLYSGKWYYGSSGSLASGWRSVSGKKYYFNRTTKVMMTGVLSLSGKYYYLGSDGAQKTGWQKPGSYWYYFGESGGAASIGWKKIGGTWYYFKSNGRMVTGTVTIDGKRYRFASSGAWIG